MKNDRFSQLLVVLLVFMTIALIHSFREPRRPGIEIKRLPARSVQPIALPIQTNHTPTVTLRKTESKPQPPQEAHDTQTIQALNSLSLIENAPSLVHSELEAKKAMMSLRLCTAGTPNSHFTSQMQAACRSALQKLAEKFPSIVKDATETEPRK